MPSLRAVVAAVAIAIVSIPVTACSGAQADDLVELLQDALALIQDQRWSEFRADAVNDLFQNAEQRQDASERFFRNSWPSDLPIPSSRNDSTDDFRTHVGEGRDMVGRWTTSSADAAEYGDRLADAGMRRVSATTETDPATGWTTTTSTYRDGSGRTVQVTSTDNSSGFGDVIVRINPGN